jgi:hypothetical protein
MATAAVGAFLQDAQVYPVEAMVRAVRTVPDPKIAESAARALSLGAALVRGGDQPHRNGTR